MTNDFINPFGIQVSIGDTGVLLSYPLNSKDTVELYFASVDSVLKRFKLKHINEVTGVELLSYR